MKPWRFCEKDRSDPRSVPRTPGRRRQAEPLRSFSQKWSDIGYLGTRRVSPSATTVRLFTPTGWVIGTLHVPEGVGLLPFLNGDEAFFRMTNVSLPEQPRSIPFLALQRKAVLIVVPGEDALLGLHEHDRRKRHEVACLFDGGLVMGTLPLPKGVRVSDELMQSEEFFAIEDCTLGIDASPEPVMEAEELVFVHAAEMFGVAELEAE